MSFILLLLRSNRNSFSTQRPYELDESCALFGNAHFDVLKKTVLYIHNYLEGPNHESVNVIVDSYLQRNDHNILVLDWFQISKWKLPYWCSSKRKTGIALNCFALVLLWFAFLLYCVMEKKLFCIIWWKKCNLISCQ